MYLQFMGYVKKLKQNILKNKNWIGKHNKLVKKNRL